MGHGLHTQLHAGDRTDQLRVRLPYLLLTFYVMLHLFHASEALFHTGWFVESIATQVLVIFVIRTRFNPFFSRPHPLLVGTSLTVVALAALLPFTPLGRFLQFVPLPLNFFLILFSLAVAYLLAAEAAKRWFFRHQSRAAGSGG